MASSCWAARASAGALLLGEPQDVCGANDAARLPKGRPHINGGYAVNEPGESAIGSSNEVSQKFAPKPPMDQLEWYCFPFHQSSVHSPAYGQQVEGIWWQSRLSVLRSGQGICSVEGLFKQGSWNILVFLASQFQAKQAVDFNLNNHAKTSRVDVLMNSQINWVTSRRSHGWTCVCGIIFSASSAWSVLPLANSGVLRRQLQFTVLHSCERLVCG